MCKELRVQRIVTLVVVAALALLALGGCDSSGDEDGSIRVVATTTILGDLAQNVIGGAGEVVVLMPIGVNPHDFQPSAQQVAAVQQPVEHRGVMNTGLRYKITAGPDAQQAGGEIRIGGDRELCLPGGMHKGFP